MFILEKFFFFIHLMFLKIDFFLLNENRIKFTVRFDDRGKWFFLFGGGFVIEGLRDDL